MLVFYIGYIFVVHHFFYKGTIMGNFFLPMTIAIALNGYKIERVKDEFKIENSHKINKFFEFSNVVGIFIMSYVLLIKYAGINNI